MVFWVVWVFTVLAVIVSFVWFLGIAWWDGGFGSGAGLNVGLWFLGTALGRLFWWVTCDFVVSGDCLAVGVCCGLV